MLTAQIIATGFVHHSNIRLHHTVQAAMDAGYFVIPAGPVVATLTAFQSAIWGGLFFTLSVGVGLTLVSWAALRLWQVVFKQNKWVLRSYLVIWAVLLVWVNRQGLAWPPTLFCLLVPLATALALWIGTAGRQSRHDMGWLLPMGTLVLLTALWATQLNADLFTAIRDRVLLSNPVGQVVNDFYYRYTLYAAQSFKSLKQKTFRSYKLPPGHREPLNRDMIRRLSQFDMLYLPTIEHPDFTVAIKGSRVVLTTAHGRPMETTIQQIMANPLQWLQKLSNTSDRYGPLRRLCLVGLLLGFPVLLYVMVYGLIKMLMGRVLNLRPATTAASGLCLVIGLLLLVPMISGNRLQISKSNLAEALTSDQWSHRAAALSFIEKQRLDIGRYPQYKPLLASPRVAERYYLARAMATSRSPVTYNDLTSMLSDPHPIVVCQVYYALGRQGRRSAIAAIRSQMASSHHWYTQWYGYKALRRLGWYPSPSK